MRREEDMMQMWRWWWENQTWKNGGEESKKREDVGCMKESEIRSLNKEGVGHELWGVEGRLGRDERKRKFKKEIVISGYSIEGKGIKGDNWKTEWKDRGKNGRQLIINSSLYKSTSVPGSLWQCVFKNITAVDEVVRHSAWCCNYERIWRPQRAIQSNNYRCTVKVSSSKTVQATNHCFHLSLSSPNMMTNKPLMAFLSHVTHVHTYPCVCRRCATCITAVMQNRLMCSCVHALKRRMFCLRVFCTAGDVSQHLSSSFKAAFPARGNLWGRTGCFKVCLFDKLWIKCRVGRSKSRSYLRSRLWHCCAGKTEDATRGKSQTKGGFASKRGKAAECRNLTVCLIYRG